MSNNDIGKIMNDLAIGNFKIPTFQSPIPIRIKMPAEQMYERIVRSIIDFENALDSTQEVGARLVNFSACEVIAIDNVGWRGGDLIIFCGKTADGNAAQLLQHFSQVNMLLVALKVNNGQPNRIGFILENQLKG